MNVEKSLTNYKAYYINKSDSNGVYSVSCHCNKEHVEVTKRNIPKRIKEYVRDARNDNPNISDLSVHLRREKRQIQHLKALDNTTSNIKRNIKESDY